MYTSRRIPFDPYASSGLEVAFSAAVASLHRASLDPPTGVRAQSAAAVYEGFEVALAQGTLGPCCDGFVCDAGSKAPESAQAGVCVPAPSPPPPTAPEHTTPPHLVDEESTVWVEVLSTLGIVFVAGCCVVVWFCFSCRRDDSKGYTALTKAPARPGAQRRRLQQLSVPAMKEPLLRRKAVTC